MVELLIYMGLMSIMLAVVSQLFASIFDVKVESEATAVAEEDGRYILSRLIYDIGRASAVTTPASYGGSGSSLVLTIGGVANTYAISSGALNLTNGSGTNRLNGSQTTVSVLSFQKLGNSSANETVKVAFTVTSVAKEHGINEVRTYQTTIGRR